MYEQLAIEKKGGNQVLDNYIINKEAKIKLLKSLKKLGDPMAKYLQRYCDFENNKYVTNYYECRKNRGAIYILVDVTYKIKGGEKSLRNKTADICSMLYDYIEEFRIKEMKTIS